MLWYKIWLLTIFLALRGLSEDARSLTMSSVFLEASLNPSFKHTRYFSTCMPNRSRCFLESEGRLSFSCRYKQCYHQLPATWLISEKKQHGPCLLSLALIQRWGKDDGEVWNIAHWRRGCAVEGIHLSASDSRCPCALNIPRAVCLGENPSKSFWCYKMEPSPLQLGWALLQNSIIVGSFRISSLDPILPIHEEWIHHICLGDIQRSCLRLTRCLTPWEQAEIQVILSDP